MDDDYEPEECTLEPDHHGPCNGDYPSASCPIWDRLEHDAQPWYVKLLREVRGRISYAWGDFVGGILVLFNIREDHDEIPWDWRYDLPTRMSLTYALEQFKFAWWTLRHGVPREGY